ncbi:MAG: TonB-dependent siderophore receptor [Pantoea sp.]|uniref:TonB-dependent siderophore receptor n=1 Tax=Pantoea sp. TaxID=69393 RepID=UPI0039E2659F
MRHRTFQRTPLSAMLLILFSSAPAWAADNNNTHDTTLTVTANNNVDSDGGDADSWNQVAKKADSVTKSSRPLIETPQSISVITQAQMASQGALNVAQALRYNSGIGSEGGGADYRFDDITIRGFSADEFLDGLRLPTVTYWSRPNFDTFLLDRVEVVKGPDSVTFGQASPGGVVNMVSKRPTAEPIHQIFVSTGSHNLFETGLDLSGALDNDEHWLGRITGTWSRSDTQVDYTKYKHYDIAPALTWQPNDDTRLTLLSQFRKDPYTGFYNQMPLEGSLIHLAQGNFSDNFYGGQPGFDYYRREQASVGYDFMHKFDDTWSVHQNLRYLHTSSDYQMVYPTGTNVDGSATVSRDSMRIIESFNAFDVDTNVQGNLYTGPVNHAVTLGMDYVHDDLRQNSGYGTASDISYLNPDYSTPVASPSIDYHNRSFMTQLGFYMQDSMKWNHWILNLGGRYDQAQSRAQNWNTATRTELNDYATTGRAGLMYHFDNGIAPYISYGTSFQPQSGTTYGGAPFKPTKGKQSEVGIKYQPNGFNALFSAALYDLRQTNVLTADPDHVNYSVQTGEIRSQGFELEGKANITSRWLVNASYALTNPKVISANDDTEGKQPVAIARQTASLWTEYALPGIFDGITLGGGARYVGTNYATTDNSLKVPARTIYDAMMRYRWQEWQLALNLQNLTDKQYISNCNDLGCHFGLRRQLIATVSYQW